MRWDDQVKTRRVCRRLFALGALTSIVLGLVGCGNNSGTPTSPCTATSVNVGPLKYVSTLVNQAKPTESPLDWIYNSSLGAGLNCASRATWDLSSRSWTCPTLGSLLVGSGVSNAITDPAHFSGAPGSEIVTSPIYNVDGTLIPATGGKVQCDGAIK